MKWLATALIASAILPSALHAKGLDKLQPDTEDKSSEEDDSKEKDEAPPSRDGEQNGVKGEAEVKEKAHEKPKGKDMKKTGETEKAAAPKETEIPVEPGFQQAYVGTSLSAIGLKRSEGSWHSAATGDLEGGYRLLKGYQGKYDIYGTLRYRPADVTVDRNQRAYRGVVETYLFGAKGQYEFMPRLYGVASAELGRSKATLRPTDGITKVDGALVKSGVDLSLGAGVSYLVLDKITLGAQLHLGAGTYQSTQFGLDLRFLL